MCYSAVITRFNKHAIVHITALTEEEYYSEFEATKDTPYLDQRGRAIGCPFVRSLNITDRVITALHCIMNMIEGTKTTSMENVRTGVLEKKSLSKKQG